MLILEVFYKTYREFKRTDLYNGKSPIFLILRKLLLIKYLNNYTVLLHIM